MSKELATVDFDIRNEDWYKSLYEDCEAIRVEFGFQARELIIQSKWEIGKRICEENENMERQKIYGKKVISTLSKDIKMSESDLNDSVLFYKQYALPTYEKAQEKFTWGKDVGWYQVKHNYLGSRGEKKEQSAKQKYAIKDILEVMTVWLEERGLVPENKTEEWVEDFRQYLQQKKG